MAINKTNLRNQVQTRIDGLTGTETLKDLLILSKAAEGLNVTRTALDTAIEAALGGLDGASEVKDLLVGNKSAADEVATLLGVNNHTTAEVNAARDSVIDAAKQPVLVGGGGERFQSSGTITPPNGCRVRITAVAGEGSTAKGTIDAGSKELMSLIEFPIGGVALDVYGEKDEPVTIYLAFSTTAYFYYSIEKV